MLIMCSCEERVSEKCSILLRLVQPTNHNWQPFQDELDTSQIASQFIADFVFYASLNFVGFYLRMVNEINMRRGFLDKRSSIETTFKLKYEKEQEVCK